MPKRRNEMYVYLARRDKKGVKILASFDHQATVHPTRVDLGDIPGLGMDPGMNSLVAREAFDNRMHYELYLETAESFDGLRSSLAGRGYSRVPSHKISPAINRGMINGKLLVTERSTMMKRGSKVR